MPRQPWRTLTLTLSSKIPTTILLAAWPATLTLTTSRKSVAIYSLDQPELCRPRNAGVPFHHAQFTSPPKISTSDHPSQPQRLKDGIAAMAPLPPSSTLETTPKFIHIPYSSISIALRYSWSIGRRNPFSLFIRLGYISLAFGRVCSHISCFAL